MRYGPFQPESLTYFKLRDAPHNCFLITEGSLMWKAALGERMPIYVPITGEQAFTDQNWTPPQLAVPGAVISAGEIRVSLGLGTSSQISATDRWPAGQLCLLPEGQLAMAIVSFAIGGMQRNLLVELKTGNTVHHWNENTRAIWFASWELHGVGEGDERFTLARSPEAA